MKNVITKGIRGAITVDENSSEAIRAATLELLSELLIKNSIDVKDISHVILTTTKDLDAEFPAKFARLEMGFDDIAMMCFHEMDVQGALEKCLRAMVVVNCDESFKPQFVYLKGASNLR